MSFNFKLEDFIPYYISPENEDDNIEKDVSIYNNIILKKEFDELRLGKVDEVKKGELYKQQSFFCYQYSLLLHCYFLQH